MLTIKNLTKKYGRITADNNLSLTVSDGEIALLYGKNGAGKSSLLKCAAGLLRYSGSVTVCGADNRTASARQMLAYVPETPSVYGLLTIAEHIEFIRRAYRLGKEYAPYCEDLLRRSVSLEDDREFIGGVLHIKPHEACSCEHPSESRRRQRCCIVYFSGFLDHVRSDGKVDPV